MAQTFKFLVVIFLMSVSFPTIVWAGELEDGKAAYEKGDYATALEKWIPLADQGHAPAQFNLGVMYASGQGVPQDYAAAINWYRKAADQGHAKAQSNLGIMYFLIAEPVDANDFTRVVF